MYKYIVGHLQTHPHFQELVFGFGQRTMSKDEMFVGWARNIVYDVSSKVEPVEFGKI